MVMNSIQTVLNSADQRTYSEILESLMQAASMMAIQNQNDYWMSDDGQTGLFRRIEVRNEKPASYLSMFDYTDWTKHMLCSTGPSSEEEEWIEME